MIFADLFRSAENPSVPISAALEDLSSVTSSGLAINRTEALKLSPLYRAVALISGDIARLPLDIYTRVDGGKQKDRATELAQLIGQKANPRTTAFLWKRTTAAHMILSGNAYTYVQRDASARPRALYILDPDRVTPTLVKDDDGADQLFYVVHTSTGETIGYEASQVIHFAGHGWDGTRGYPALQVLSETIGHGLATRKFGSTFFKNNARPGMVLEHPARLTADQVTSLRDQWTKSQASVENAHKVAVLHDGMKASAITVNAKDSQLVEAQRFNLIDIANFFGVPPHKLGHDSRTSFSSLAEENQSYLDEALDPWLCLMEAEIYDKILSERVKTSDTKVVEFNRAALLRADIAKRGEYYNRALSGAPWMTVNETRARENMLPIAGGDALLLPTNNFGNPENPADPAPPADPPGIADSATQTEDQDRASALDAIKRKHAAEVDRITRRIRANIERRGADWWPKHETAERAAAAEILGDLSTALHALGHAVPAPEQIVNQILNQGQAA